MAYRTGQRVRPKTSIQRSNGAAWPSHTGTIEKVTEAGSSPTEYKVRFDNGFTAEVVYEGEIQPV
jgi:hypothetical protein